MYTCLCVVDPYRLHPVAVVVAAASMHAKISPASLPPPTASKANVAEVASSAAVRSARNVGELELHTQVAPIALSRSSCSGLRTMLTSGIWPSGSSRHWDVFTHRYCEYIAPPRTATVLVIRAWAAADEIDGGRPLPSGRFYLSPIRRTQLVGQLVVATGAVRESP